MMNAHELIKQNLPLVFSGSFLLTTAAVSHYTRISKPSVVLFHNVVRGLIETLAHGAIKNIRCTSLSLKAYPMLFANTFPNFEVKKREQSAKKAISDFQLYTNSSLGPVESVLASPFISYLSHSVAHYDILNLKPYFGMSNNPENRLSYWSMLKVNTISLVCIASIGSLYTTKKS